MSFFGKVKQATGIGLDGQSSYRRAFERGVLTGDQRGAAGMFRDAAARLAHEGNTGLAQRANANALIYTLLSGGGAGVLQPLRDALAQLDEIEQFGTPSEFMPAQPLVEELDVRIAEAQIVDSPYVAAIQSHKRALTALEKILDRPLLTYAAAPLPSDGFVCETAVARYAWHQGLTSRLQALTAVGTSPVEAANLASAAGQAFRRAGDAARLQEAEQLAQALLVRRSCWICHREMQGLGQYLNWYPSVVARYTVDVLERAGQDQGSVDLHRSQVIVCTPCGTLVQQQADRYAQLRTNEVRAELGGRIAMLESALADLERRFQHHSH